MQKLMKVGTCWHFSMWKSWTMKINIASPSAWGPSKKEAILLVIFSIGWLGQCAGIAKNASLIAATFADAWQELGTILAIIWRGSREQEPCGANPAKPGRTDLRKPGTQRNLAEPSGAAEPSGTRQEPGKTRQRNPAEPGGIRRNLAETRKKSKLKGGVVGSITFGMVYTPNPPLQLTFFPPGSARFPPGFRRVPPGSAGFRQVPPGFAGFW